MRRILLHKVTLAITSVIVVSLFIFLLTWKSTESFENIPVTTNLQNEQPKNTSATSITTSKPLLTYLEIVDACGPSLVGSCVNIRSGPGENYAIVERLRKGIVLRVSDIVTANGREWYKIKTDEEVRFPERIKGDWFIASGDYVQLFKDVGTQELTAKNHATSTKRIVVDISEQMIYAYDGDTMFMKESISTGLEFTPTPYGTFTVYRKTPSRYMQGPIPGVSDQYYDLPGVPWDLYFTVDGAVIHGTYWHDHFGEPWSHGCVNLSTKNAKKLYFWADVGIPVIVQN